jgi:hypothetical protein
LAAVPVLGFLALGYLLETGGRVARAGRLPSRPPGKRRNFLVRLVLAGPRLVSFLVRYGLHVLGAFPGVRRAGLVGVIVAGAYLMILPPRLFSDYARSAEIIDATSTTAQWLRLGTVALTLSAGLASLAFALALLVLYRMGCAWLRGERPRLYFWPFHPIRFYVDARDATWEFIASLRLPYYFWLGLRGFAGAFIWLVLPISLLALGSRLPPVGIIGAFLLAIVLLYLPFLQIHFAVENRFRALFALGAVRRNFKKAPYAFTFALFITLLFAVPLYLLKIEMVPREAAWLPCLVFMIFIFPARVLAGWAYGLALHRPNPRHWFFRWTARIPHFPMAIFYVFILFWTQYTAWEGVFSLYAQHAFMLPVPFMGS